MNQKEELLCPKCNSKLVSFESHFVHDEFGYVGEMNTMKCEKCNTIFPTHLVDTMLDREHESYMDGH